ncbi:MAG TPA: MlaD family protein [Bryobacteraceae bacterium]|jgi:phospholipid/cholesterol/gamma-HCH transport system substrate-binding protein
MPSKEKVSMAQLKVGILGIVACSCIALIIFLLTGNMRWFQKEIPLHMYTSDAGGLTKGAPVRINGITAGKVDAVDLSGERTPARVIKVDFHVDEDMLKQIPSDSIGSISSENLLGSTKFLQINKGTSTTTVQPNSILKAADTKQFDELVAQGFGILDSLQATLEKVQNIVANVENGKGTIGKLLVDQTLYNSLQATVSQVQLLVTTLNSKTGTVGRLINDNELYDQIRGVITKVDQLTAGLQQGQGTAGMLLKDPKVYNDLDSALVEINTLTHDLNAGKGTAGQLLKNDKIARQLSTALDKVNLTLDKVNSGQGTLGQLMVNPALYEETTGMMRELHATLKDFRANPKKFLSIKLHIF